VRLELAKLYDRTHDSSQALHAQSAEILELGERLEVLTKGTDAWYSGMRTRVEVRATVEQAEELRRTLEQLGEKLGGQGERESRSWTAIDISGRFTRE
jgi:hypothetical protein